MKQIRLFGLILLVGGFIIWKWSELTPLEWILMGFGAVIIIFSFLLKRG